MRGRYPEVERKVMQSWLRMQVDDLMRNHDKDSDGFLDLKEVEEAHHVLWTMTHDPSHVHFLKDEL